MKLQAKAKKPMHDEQIVALYWQRDEQAIRETDVKYKNFLLSVAINILHDACESEECLNDTYIGAWNSIPPARPTRLQAFLATIMRRKAIDCYRARKRQKRVASELTVSLSEVEELEAPPIEFDEKLWHAVVDRVTVYNDDRLVYSLKDGSEITVRL